MRIKYTYVIPIKLESLANKREHWAARSRRAKKQREAAYICTPRVNLPASVKITRIAPRMLDDDNLAISGKHVRDGIADRLGVDDASPLIEWSYDQRKGKPKQYACEIEIVELVEH